VDPDSGSGTFFDPGIRDGEKNPDPGSGMNIPDHFSESLGTVLGLRILKIFDADPGDPESF
jgi:hypothetical protein